MCCGTPPGVLRDTLLIMIDVRQINETYHVGREKPGGESLTS